MHKDTAPHATHECYACGLKRDERGMRPFGWNGATVATWICQDCARPVLPKTPRPAPTLLDRADLEVLA